MAKKAKPEKTASSSAHSRAKKGTAPTTPFIRSSARSNHLQLPRGNYEDLLTLIEPQINAEGVHTWNFDAACPVDLLFLIEDSRHRVRMNRHSYFEVFYLCSGSLLCHIQERSLRMRAGDLAVIGSTLYHSVECVSTSPATIAALFFDPEIIRSEGASDSVEYLTPFLLQDAQFPHIVSAESGLPRQILECMLRMYSERRSNPHLRLTLKTYLKLILVTLVNHYATYNGTIEVFCRQERAIGRIRPLFQHLEEKFGSPIQIRQAARICGMSDSHFMGLFKEVTGMSFLQYLNHYRAEKAKVMLAFSDDSIKKICQDAGFCDQSYFGAVFRKIVGVPPAEFRRAARKAGPQGLPRVHQSSSLRDGGSALSPRTFRF